MKGRADAPTVPKPAPRLAGRQAAAEYGHSFLSKQRQRGVAVRRGSASPAARKFRLGWQAGCARSKEQRKTFTRHAHSYTSPKQPRASAALRSKTIQPSPQPALPPGSDLRHASPAARPCCCWTSSVHRRLSFARPPTHVPSRRAPSQGSNSSLRRAAGAGAWRSRLASRRASAGMG